MSAEGEERKWVTLDNLQTQNEQQDANITCTNLFWMILDQQKNQICLAFVKDARAL